MKIPAIMNSVTYEQRSPTFTARRSGRRGRRAFANLIGGSVRPLRAHVELKKVALTPPQDKLLPCFTGFCQPSKGGTDPCNAYTGVRSSS